MQSTRRRTLQALGAAVGAASTAGCLSGDTDLPTQDDGNGTDDGSKTPTGTGAVTVRSVSTRPELVTRNSPDSYGTYGGRASQWVVAEVAVETPDAHPPSSFAIEADGGTHEAVTDVGYGSGFLAEFGDAYGTRGAEAGWLAFQLPKPLEAESAALIWNGGSYALAASVLERLRRPPTDVEVDFEAPGSATVGETVTATVEVANVGEVDGRFVGALNRVGPLIAYAPEAAVVLDVAAGETATWTYSHTLEDRFDGEEDREMRLHLLWDDERATRTVTVRQE